jgi:hypothetical protein
MKTMIRRVLGKQDALPALRHSALSSEMTTHDIEAYYLRIISDCLRRLLVQPDTVEIRIKRAGAGPTGLPGFAGCVRVVRWDHVVTPVLLQNMPVVDARVRQLADTSVILEHTHFAGLWFQATSTAEGAPTALAGLPAELVHQAGGPVMDSN